jgi:hypothetical protein
MSTAGISHAEAWMVLCWHVERMKVVIFTQQLIFSQNEIERDRLRREPRQARGHGSRLRLTAPTVIVSGETEAAKAGRSTSDKDNFFGNNATSMTKAKITPIATSNRSTAAPIRRRAQFCSSPRQSCVIAPGMQPSPDFIRIAGGPRCRPRAALPLLACNAFCSHDGSATEQY